MDFQAPALLFTVTFIFFSLYISATITAKIKGRNSKVASMLPPGPWRLPLIGNMHQLVAHPLPHHLLRNMALKYGPIMYLKLGVVPTFVVSSADFAKQILKDHDLVFAQRPQTLGPRIMTYESTDVVFSEYGDYWRQLRKICILELLSSKRVRSFRSIRETHVSDLISMVYCNKDLPTNISEMIFSLTYGTTATAAFGKKCKDQEAFVAVVKQVVKLFGGFSIADMYPSMDILSVLSGTKQKLKKMHWTADKILDNIIKEHRQGRDSLASNEDAAADLVDLLLRVQRNSNLRFPLTDDNIKAVLLDIFSAGSETSSTAVEWAMSELVKNPRIMKKAQEEIRQVFYGKRTVDEAGLQELRYLKSVVKETLRLHPSAPLLVPREARETCKINGYELPAKSKVIVNAWAIAQDPKYWEDAERFHPERFDENRVDYRGTDFQFIPFGAGRRICPGIAFAIANIELPLAQLLYHFDWEVANGRNEDVDMTEEFGITVRRKNDLYLIPKPYHSSSYQAVIDK